MSPRVASDPGFIGGFNGRLNVRESGRVTEGIGRGAAAGDQRMTDFICVLSLRMKTTPIA